MLDDRLKCLNPWDPQSKRQYQIDGVYCALNAGQAIGGQAHGICYAVEGNIVDRVSKKNGKGWCEGVSPTLNTQDRHAVVYSISNKQQSLATQENIAATLGANDYKEPQCVVYDGSSVTSPKNWNNPKPGDPCYALHTDSRNYVVISLEGNGARPSHMGNGYSEKGTMYTLNTIETHSVCYSVDCRNLCVNEEKSCTLQAKNNGGFSYNFLNPVLMENKE